MRSRSLFARVLFVVMLGILTSGCTLFESKARSGVQIITGDVPSIIYLDEQVIGTAPFIEKNLKPGTYALRIEPTDPQFVPHEMTLTLRRSFLTVITWNPGADTDLSSGVVYEMEALPNSTDTEVVFRSQPEGAIVSVQGRQKEFTPAVFTTIPAGDLEFEISLPSYEIQHHTLAVKPGFRMLVTVKLAKLQLPGEMDPVVESAVELETELKASESAVLSAAIDLGFVRIKRTGYMVDGAEVIRVRAEPSGSGVELKTIPVEKRYPYLGETVDDWHKIDAQGTPGWINGDFAVLELPE